MDVVEMNDITVAVVDAETPGNVGTIARAMKNFGFEDLLLVDPPELDPDGEAYGFAGHAREDVLPAAREIDFDCLIEQYYTVGFTAVTNEDGGRHTRYPFVTPLELREELAGIDATTALVFGRERIGLTNEELARIDRICSIPASQEYPALNLGQAATIALYELRDLGVEETQLPEITDRASAYEIEAFHEHFDQFLDQLHFPDEKHAKTLRLLRRLIGRAHPTGRELKTLRGILRRAGTAANLGRDSTEIDESESETSQP